MFFRACVEIPTLVLMERGRGLCSLRAEIEIVYNNTRINRLISLGPPCCAYSKSHWTGARP
jgi:hypothetical protein